MTRSFGKRLQGSPDVPYIFRVKRTIVLILFVELGDALFVRFAARSVIACISEYFVDRDSMQPGAERAAPFEARKIPPRTYERLLHTILRDIRTTSHPQTQAIHTTAMPPVQLLEGAHITAPRTRNEQPVGRRLTIGTDDRVT